MLVCMLNFLYLLGLSQLTVTLKNSIRNKDFGNKTKQADEVNKHLSAVTYPLSTST